MRQQQHENAAKAHALKGSPLESTDCSRDPACDAHSPSGINSGTERALCTMASATTCSSVVVLPVPGGAMTVISLNVSSAAARPGNVKGALVFTVGHAEVQGATACAAAMPPCAGRRRYRFRRRGDQPRRDSVDVVFRRKSQPINKDLNRGIDRGGGEPVDLAALRAPRWPGKNAFRRRIFHFRSISTVKCCSRRSRRPCHPSGTAKCRCCGGAVARWSGTDRNEVHRETLR